MNTSERSRQERLCYYYDGAAARPPAERHAWLEAACPRDPDLRHEVLALLRRAETPNISIFTTAPTAAADLAETPAFASSARDGSHARSGAVPDTIGPYRLRGRLGEGTYGVIYEVEQTRPIRRSLALKLLKPGMDTQEILSRFALERQTLALLDHPNIARVVDAGATPDGRPYFVMELVRGEPVTAYCDRLRLGIRARLELFREICLAVQHAHQRGVLHRDLKPANILVALVEGRPLVKIIDFGLAKVAGAARLAGVASAAANAAATGANDMSDGAGAAEPLATLPGRAVGTPAYMSPEQAAASALGVDTATDVYSLGVILYELLCGRLPHGAELFRGRAPAEYEDLLRRSATLPPSRRWRPVNAAIATLAERRGGDIQRVRVMLRGDLDWITLRALEPDRLRRYQTVQDLLLELQRYFADEPVQAAPPSLVYRARKSMRRHRRGLALAGIVAAALSVAAGGLTYSLVTAQRERAAAVAARAEAENVLAFLSTMFGAAVPGAEGRDVTVVEVLDAAATRVSRDFAGQPDVAARLHLVMARVYRDLARFDEAAHHLAQGLALRPPLDRSTTALRREQGLLLRDTGRYAAADSTFVALLHEQRHGERRTATDLVTALIDLGGVRVLNEQPDAAITILEEARDLIAAGAAVGPDLRSSLLTALGSAYLAKGEFDAAEKLLLAALELDRNHLGPDHPGLLADMQSLGSLYRQAGRHADALPLYERSWDLAREVYGPDHPTTLRFLSNYALGLSDAGRLNEALTHTEAVVRRRETLLGPDNPATLASRLNLALLYLRLNDPATALATIRETRARVLTALGPDHLYTPVAEGLLGQALHEGGDPRAAEPHLAASVAALRSQLPAESWRIGRALTLWGRCLVDLERNDAAEAALTEAHRILEAALGAEDARTREAAAGLQEAVERSAAAKEPTSRATASRAG